MANVDTHMTSCRQMSLPPLPLFFLLLKLHLLLLKLILHLLTLLSVDELAAYPFLSVLEDAWEGGGGLVLLHQSNDRGL